MLSTPVFSFIEHDVSVAQARYKLTVVITSNTCFVEAISCLRVFLKLLLLLAPVLSASVPFVVTWKAGEFAQEDGHHWFDLFILTGWVLVLRIAHFCVIFSGVKPYRKAMSVLTV